MCNITVLNFSEPEDVYNDHTTKSPVDFKNTTETSRQEQPPDSKVGTFEFIEVSNFGTVTQQYSDSIELHLCKTHEHGHKAFRIQTQTTNQPFNCSELEKVNVRKNENEIKKNILNAVCDISHF